MTKDKTVTMSRALFQAANPVPYGVFWSEPDSRYMTNMVHLNCLEYQGKWLGWQSAMSAAPVVERQEPVPEYFVEACDKFDWTPEEALRFYADGKHFDIENGRTRILDSGAIASYALKNLNGDYAVMKGAERQPTAWLLDGSVGGSSLDFQITDLIETQNRHGGCLVPLYAEQPAPVAVLNIRNFANAMIDIALEGADADGGHIQELAIKHGLLKPEQRTERCGDTCVCAEYADFPVECFRKVKELNQ